MSSYKKIDEKIKYMTEAKIYPLLLKMAFPSIVGMLVISLYTLADTYFIGLLDKSYLTAAIGLVFSFTSLLQAIGFWFGYGSGNYISRKLGRGELKEAQTMAVNGLVLAIIGGVIIATLSLIFIIPLTVGLGASRNSEMFSLTLSYLRITIFSIPFMLGANVLYNELRLQGSGKDSMFGVLLGISANTALDPIFILWLDMGVDGAALASLIGQFIAFVFLFYLSSKDGNVSIYFKNLKLNLFYIKKILMGGLPNFSRQGISSFSLVLFNNVAGNFGSETVAGLTIALRVYTFVLLIAVGFGQGFQPICAMNYGAQKYERIKKAFKYALITITIYLLIFATSLYFNAEILIGLFSAESEVIFVGTSILRALSFVIPFMGLYILTSMFLQNIGQFTKATLVSIAESGTFFIPAIIILPFIFGFDGFVWAKPVAGICALIFSLFIGGKAWNKYLNGEERK